MNSKPVIVLVDNRGLLDTPMEEKTTEPDCGNEDDQVLPLFNEPEIISQLEDRVAKLEKRVNKLEKIDFYQKIDKRHRRKASQILRQFKCPVEECEKFYGSDTSLKNHIKLKHPGKLLP